MAGHWRGFVILVVPDYRIKELIFMIAPIPCQGSGAEQDGH